MLDYMWSILLKLYLCCIPCCSIIYKYLYILISFPITHCKICIQYFFPKTNILFINNNTICHSFNYSDLTDYLLIDYEYIIYNEPLGDKTLVKIMNDINQLTEFHNTNQVLKLCELEFILVLIKGKDYSIDITNILKDNDNNYYVQEGILFNDHFINWFSIHHLKKKLDDYYILFLDNKMNDVILKNNEFIKLSEDSYTIMSSDSTLLKK